jgi:hypothetical protein
MAGRIIASMVLGYTRMNGIGMGKKRPKEKGRGVGEERILFWNQTVEHRPKGCAALSRSISFKPPVLPEVTDSLSVKIKIKIKIKSGKNLLILSKNLLILDARFARS